MDQYCLLVNSCDAYADCWPPFFTLLSAYWKPHDRAIYLNTETSGFAFGDLDIRCPRVGLTASRSLAWSERLRRCLETIPHEVVLYLQEDYFLKDYADVSMIDRLADVMIRDDISHISLVPDGRPGEKSSSYPFLTRIDQRAEYRVTAQAGLWKVGALTSYLRPHETVWEFEWYGTRRARRKKDSFFYVNDDYTAKSGGASVFPYDRTGIEQGLWKRSVVKELFARHGIIVDYERRGFLEDHRGYTRPRPPRILRAFRRLRSLT